MRENEAAKRFMQPILTKDQLLTVNDFNEMKAQLLHEIRQLVKEVTGKPTKQWLKTHEVKKLLGISQSTLQTLRDNGTLPFTKIGGVFYYSTSEIQQLLDRKRQLETGISNLDIFCIKAMSKIHINIIS